jgi:repressor LexA
MALPPRLARSAARTTSDNLEPPRLTARQQQILDWIRGHMEATGMPPTRAEIATGLGFSTASSAEDHLQALAKKGALELTPGAARGCACAICPACRSRARCRSSAASRRAPSSPPSTSRRSAGSTPRSSRRAPTTCCA